MLIDPVNPILIPPIQRVSSLPYWETYTEWTDHLSECAQCLAVMDTAAGGSEKIVDLCLVGRLLATAVQWDIDSQRQLSAFN